MLDLLIKWKVTGVTIAAGLGLGVYGAYIVEGRTGFLQGIYDGNISGARSETAG